MKDNWRQLLTLFLIGGFIKMILPSNMDGYLFYGSIFLLVIFLINAHFFINKNLYIRFLVIILGMVVIHCKDYMYIMAVDIICKVIEYILNMFQIEVNNKLPISKYSVFDIIVILAFWIGIISLAICKYQYEKITLSVVKPKLIWERGNLFKIRNRDLERLANLVKKNNTTTIGLEGEWGEGKSFLIDGLVETLNNETKKYEFIRIDVMAVRLDKFAEYLIQELNNFLIAKGIISGNMQKLKELFQNIKISNASLLWNGTDTRYSKIFDNFRKELLSLNCCIILIYEDLDRISDANTVRNILYLSEKLTAINSYAEYGGIKVIYQYDRAYINKMGLSDYFLEKYIKNHINLTPISLAKIIKSLKTRCSCELSDDEISNILMANGFLVDKKFNGEDDLIRDYLSSGITIRKTEAFLNAVKDGFKAYGEPSKIERCIIIAFYYIEYFLPAAYSRLKKAEILPLSQVMYIENAKGEKINLSTFFHDAIVSNDDNNDIYVSYLKKQKLIELKNILTLNINKEKPNEVIEVYWAYRMLGLDKVAVADNNSNEEKKRTEDLCQSNMKQLEIAEGLPYIRIERIVKFLLSAGNIAYDSYRFWGGRLLKELPEISSEKSAVDFYNNFIKEMNDDDIEAGTIFLIGRNHWIPIFNAFKFASIEKNKDTRLEYFTKVITLYKYVKLNDKKTSFDMEFISETMPLWEAVRDGDCLVLISKLICSRNPICNWNKWSVFYKYVSECLNTIIYSGYIKKISLRDIRSLEKMIDNVVKDNSCKKLLLNLIADTKQEAEDNYRFINEHKDYFYEDISKYEEIINLMDFFKRVINNTVDGDLLKHPNLSIRSVAKDVSYEEQKKLLNMNEDDFKKCISNNDIKLRRVDIIEVAKKKFKKI